MTEKPTHATSRAHELPDAVERRAYELFIERGGDHGRDLDDWFEAERQVEESVVATARAHVSPRGISERDGLLLPPPRRLVAATRDSTGAAHENPMATRDHDVIREWAARRGALPATGEATRSGPATAHVNDAGVGVRFNFPGVSAFRSITWDEWFEHFDGHELAFVFEAPPSNRYRLVRKGEVSAVAGAD